MQRKRDTAISNDGISVFNIIVSGPTDDYCMSEFHSLLAKWIKQSRRFLNRILRKPVFFDRVVICLKMIIKIFKFGAGFLHYDFMIISTLN